MNAAYNAGYDCCMNGGGVELNPFSVDDPRFEAWDEGWYQANGEEEAYQGDCDPYYDDYDDSMDGDFDTAMRDAGFGTDEDYGYYGGSEDY